VSGEKRGRGRPTTGTPVQVRIPPETLAEVDRASSYFGTSRAEMVRRILASWAEIQKGGR
jgi:hypothetical protein